MQLRARRAFQESRAQREIWAKLVHLAYLDFPDSMARRVWQGPMELLGRRDLPDYRACKASLDLWERWEKTLRMLYLVSVARVAAPARKEREAGRACKGILESQHPCR